MKYVYIVINNLCDEVYDVAFSSNKKAIEWCYENVIDIIRVEPINENNECWVVTQNKYNNLNSELYIKRLALS